MVEWVEKSSFARLNKLFEIDQFERSHNVLFTEKNLRVVITQMKPFVIFLLFLWLTSPTLVSSEYFMLKDLSFYKVVCLANAEVRQARLDAHEKKCQDGTLCQASGSISGLASNLAHQLVKKKIVVQPRVQETMIELDETFGAEQIVWYETIEPVVPPIIEEAEEEEMIANLRAGFHELQHK